jgi:SAM-dependent methyltransferase
MYSEKDDFEHHDIEVDDFFSSLQTHALVIPRDAMILDVGGGQGMHASRLLPFSKKMFVVDILNYSALYDGGFLRLLKEKHGRNTREFSLERVVFLESDAQDLFFRDGLFDVVISVNAFEHIPDPRRAFTEILRVTKPGGIIYLQFDPLWHSPGGGHFSHLVTEPWAHIVYDEREYFQMLYAAGGGEFEMSEHRQAMNRCHLNAFLEIFDEAKRRGLITLLSLDKWAANATDEPNTQHSNFQLLRSRGYSEEDLIVRGIRLCAKRGAAAL